jgi:glycosyl transferase family 25
MAAVEGSKVSRMERMPPAYVINLDRSPDRLAAVRARFAAVGVDLVRFAGIDASRDPDLAARSVDQKRFQAFMRRVAQPGEVGCALSHFALWETLADGDAEMLLVLEDDAMPTEHFAAVASIAGALPDDWEICLLSSGGVSGGAGSLWSAGVGDVMLHRYWRPGYLAAGYLVHRRILRHRGLWPPHAKLAFPIDAWRCWTWLHGMAVYAVLPRPIRSDRTAASMIDHGGAVRARRARTPGQVLRSHAVRLAMHPRGAFFAARAWWRLRARPG